MGVSKVVYGGETLIDLTSDTVSQENLLDGATATNAMGEKVVGIAKGLPDQTGQSGKVLGTDGKKASWVTPTTASEMVSWLMPDWSALVSLSIGSEVTIPNKGWCLMRNTTYTTHMTGYIKVNGTLRSIYNQGGTYAKFEDWNALMIPVNTGDIVRLDGGSELLFIPCKGVSNA